MNDRLTTRYTALALQALTLACLASLSASTHAEKGVAAPLALIQALGESPHMESIAESEGPRNDHQIGLGAMQKVRGVWRFKDSERLDGELYAYTWQVLDGFASVEIVEELEAALADMPGATLLFDCAGRACGHPTQWANRVFGERLLYGRADEQRYRVYAFEGESPGRLVLYSSSRTPERQYLQTEWLAISADSDEPE